MLHRDVLWGDFSIDEPVLLDLIASPPVQRLRHIHQAGASYYLLPNKRPTTRFEHSLGVMYVLRALGAPLEEQVAGLLHDVPHTAFSHTADIVFPNDEHTFHERFQHEIIMGSPIPGILERHGVSLRAALEPHEYSLLEKPLPDLCADRIDYALRDAEGLGRISGEEARDWLSHLVTGPWGIAAGSTQAALLYSQLFREANDLLWTGAQEAGAYWALAGAIRRAYDLALFTDADLFSTDDAAMERLRAIEDPEVRAYLSLLTPGTVFREVPANEPGPYFSARMKQRTVDPLVMENGWDEPKRLSEAFGLYAKRLAEANTGQSVHYRLWSSTMPPVLAGRLAALGRV